MPPKRKAPPASPDGAAERAAKTPRIDTFGSHIQSDVAKLLVGKADQGYEEYYVHESLLCARSEFFSRALQGKFKEAKLKEVKMPETDPEALKCFIQWIYSGVILPKELNKTPEVVIDRYCKAYLCGQFVCSDEYLNALIDELRAFCRNCQKLLLLDQEFYDKLQKDVGLAKLVVESHVHVHGTGGWLDSVRKRSKEILAAGDSLSVAVLLGVIQALEVARCASPFSSEVDSCLHHVHSDGKTCDVKANK